MATPEDARSVLDEVVQLLRDLDLSLVIEEDDLAHTDGDRSPIERAIDLLDALDGSVVIPALALADGARMLNRADWSEDDPLGTGDMTESPEDIHMVIDHPAWTSDSEVLRNVRRAVFALRDQLRDAHID